MTRELPLRIGAAANCSDGACGQLSRIIVNPGRKEVAVPIGSVIKLGTLLIRLSLTRHQAKDLPSADIDRPAG